MKLRILIRPTAAVFIAIFASAHASGEIVATTPNQRPCIACRPTTTPVSAPKAPVVPVPLTPTPPPRPVQLVAPAENPTVPKVRSEKARVSFRTRGKLIAEQCRQRFVDEHGDLGSEGRRLTQLMASERYRARFLNGRSLRAVCPRFSPLWSEELQLRAWTWFWMVLANEESGCEPRTFHPTHTKSGRRINPKPGYGLYAAELYGEHRNWRGPMCRGNISQVETQLTCAVDTMAATQLSRGRGVRWVGSYWGPIRRASRQIKPNMEGFKACF